MSNKPPLISTFAPLLATGGALLMATLLFVPHYQTIDDTYQVMLASGCGVVSQPDNHLLYTHYFLANVLNWLYMNFSAVPWYGLYLTSALFLAFSTIAYVCRTRLPSTRGAWLIAAFMLSVATYYFVNLQFTSVSALVCLAGALTLLDTLETECKGRRLWLSLIWAGALFVLGSLIRQNSATLALVLFGIAVASRFLFGANGKVFKAFVFTVGIYAVLSALWLPDKQYYESDPGWRFFRKFDAADTQIIDYMRVVYNDSNIPRFRKAGLTVNDIQLVHEFFFLDYNVITPEKLEELVAGCPPWRADLSARFFGHTLSLMFEDAAVLASLVLSLALIVLADRGRLSRPRVLTLSLGVTLLVVLVACVYKTAPRVFMPIMSWLNIVLLYYSRTETVLPPRKWRVIVPIFILISIGLTGLGCHETSKQTLLAKARLARVLNYVKPKEHQLFVSCGHSMPVDGILPYENMSTVLHNVHILNTGLAHAPFSKVPHLANGEPQSIKLLTTPEVYMFSQDVLNLYFGQFLLEHFGREAWFSVWYLDPDQKCAVYKLDKCAKTEPAK